MRMGVRECGAESLDTTSTRPRGRAFLIISEQSLNQQRENHEDLGSETGRGNSTGKGPGVRLSLVYVRNSEEASMPAAGNKARKVEGSDNIRTLWAMVRGASTLSWRFYTGPEGARGFLHQGNAPGSLCFEETTLMAVVCSHV